MVNAADNLHEMFFAEWQSMVIEKRVRCQVSGSFTLYNYKNYIIKTMQSVITTAVDHLKAEVNKRKKDNNENPQTGSPWVFGDFICFGS